ncbi:MAG: DUF4157 domain-containing protein [Gammaproteobacteria bacterium]|nr:DUF4157 domain-containing protein [Gammaproteobacteria bacterium]
MASQPGSAVENVAVSPTVQPAGKRGLNPNYNTAPAITMPPVQRKFTIGKANDPFEREADTIADHVVSGKQAPPVTPVPAAGLNSVARKEKEPKADPAQPKLIQRQEEEEEPAQPQLIQRQAEEEGEEETPVQPKLIQREEKKPEEEPAQPRLIQRQEEEEEPAQARLIQREEQKPEEEPAQPRLIQRQEEEEEPAQPRLIQREEQKPEEEPAQPKLIQRQEEEKEPAQPRLIQREEQKPEEEPAQPKLIQRQEEEEEPAQPKFIQREEKKPGEEPAQPKLIQRQEEEEEPAQPKLIQREEQKPEEEPAQPKLIQRQEEEEEPAQPKFIQREEQKPEEEPAQPKLIQRQEEEEEPAQPKFIQREEQKPEEEPAQPKLIQRQEEEEEPAQPRLIQREEQKPKEDPAQPKLLQREEKKPEEPVQPKLIQREANAGSGMNQAASQAVQNKGAGQPLNPGVRDTLESSMGTDLSDVRVHDDSSAKQAAHDMNARAFTHGNDIWLGEGASQSDTHLMAHEAAHVVQQTGSVQRKLIQRAKTKTPAGKTKGSAAAATGGKGDLTTGLESGSTITFDTIAIPKFKMKDHRGVLYGGATLERAKGETVDREGDNATQQRSIWDSALGKNTAAMETILKDKQKEKFGSAKKENPVWRLVIDNKYYRYFFGDPKNVAQATVRPDWYIAGKTAKERKYHVDHIVEAQLAKWPVSKRADKITNMELLEGKKNMDSGKMIRDNIKAKITTFLKKNRGIKNPKAKDIKDIKAKYTLKFNTAVSSGKLDVRSNDFWTQDQISKGEHLKAIEATEPTDIGSKSFVRIFSRKGGGASKKFAWHGGNKPSGVKFKHEKDWLKPFVITEKYFNTASGSEMQDDFGHFKMKIPKNNPDFKESKEETVKVKRIRGAQYGGEIDRDKVVSELKALKVPYSSPISLKEIEIDAETGISAYGNLLPDIPLLKGLDIELNLINGDLVISKEFTLDEFKDKIPKPFVLNALRLKLFYSRKQKFGFEGEADFGIEKVGEGQLKAGFSMGKGITMAGNFSFVKSLFDPAEVGFTYEDGKWGASGKLGIKDGKVPGIKSAEISASYQNEEFAATGTVETKIPGIKSGGFEAKYSKKEGLMIGGTLDLSSEVPLLKSGTARARLRRKPDQSWSVYAAIEADLDIPGLKSSTVKGFYNDGIFGLTLTAAFKYGLASGTATVGVTNQGVDENGKPVEGQPSDKLLFHGVGTVSLKLSPWLTASATITYSPLGTVKIAGELAVPKEIPLFKGPKPFGPKGPSFKMKFPVLSIGVADIGVSIGGGLGVYANIGDAVLRNVKLKAEYDFANENSAKASGTAQFYMPAEAGLKGFVNVGVYGRALIVSAGGEVELGIGAAVKGAASLDLGVDWSKQKGFSINAEAKAEGMVTAFASVKGRFYVDIDYLLGSKRVWTSDDYDIAGKELGSKLKLGIVAPVSYSEKEGFKGLSMSSIRFIYPSASEAKEAIKDFAKSLF